MDENIPPPSGHSFSPPCTPPKRPSTKALGKRPMTQAQLALHYAKQPKLADDSDDEDFKRMHGVVTIPPDTQPYVPPYVPSIAPPAPRHPNQNNENTVDLTAGFLDDEDIEDIYDAATDVPEEEVPPNEELFGDDEIEAAEQAVHEIEVAIKLEIEETNGMDEEERKAYAIAKEQLMDMLGLTEEEAREELARRDEISGGRAW